VKKKAFAKFADIFSKLTSQPASFDPISLEEWGKIVSARVGSGFEEDIKQMIE
jgi:hypothetical protein